MKKKHGSKKSKKKEQVQVIIEPSKYRRTTNLPDTAPVAADKNQPREPKINSNEHGFQRKVNHDVTDSYGARSYHVPSGGRKQSIQQSLALDADMYIGKRRDREMQYTSLQSDIYRVYEHRSRERPTKPAFIERRPDQFSFYHNQIQERQSRSKSRGREPSTERVRLQSADRSRPSSVTSRDASRGRSRSRDIISLYTSPNKPRARSATPSGGLKSYIYLPQPNKSSGNMTPRSARSEIILTRSKSESRCHSVGRDAISLCSNVSTQSRAMSNSDMAAENLKLWITTTRKNQRRRSTSRSKKPDDKAMKFVPLLEMNPQINDKIESILNEANSLKPANIKMMMIAGHTPSDNWESKDEIAVPPDSLITGHYKQSEWLFISTETNDQGFVPFAYTKPLKTEKDEPRAALGPDSRIPTQNFQPVNKQNNPGRPNSNGRMKVSGGSSQDFPKYMVKVQTRDRESVSSGSVFQDEYEYLRKPFRPQLSYADCMVVDVDQKYDVHGYNAELATHCSDSGISEPTSNHSDELKLILSKQYPQTSKAATPRQSYSRSSAVSETPRSNSQHTNTLSDMPLGPLGHRLQHQRSNDENTSWRQQYYEPPHPLSADTIARAQTVNQQTDSSLAPTIPKDYNGPRVRVVYDYTGENDDDVTAQAGDVVTVLNGEDSEWIWVQCRNGMEGFLPRDYVLPLDVCRPKLKSTNPLVVAL